MYIFSTVKCHCALGHCDGTRTYTVLACIHATTITFMQLHVHAASGRAQRTFGHRNNIILSSNAMLASLQLKQDGGNQYRTPSIDNLTDGAWRYRMEQLYLAFSPHCFIYLFRPLCHDFSQGAQRKRPVLAQALTHQGRHCSHSRPAPLRPPRRPPLRLPFQALPQV